MSAEETLQHLNNLYSCARRANLDGETHDQLKHSAQAIADYISEHSPPENTDAGNSEDDSVSAD